MHLYGLRTPYKEIGLEACARYPLYVIIYCKRVHYTTDSLVWGSLRLAPIIIWLAEMLTLRKNPLLILAVFQDSTQREHTIVEI